MIMREGTRPSLMTNQKINVDKRLAQEYYTPVYNNFSILEADDVDDDSLSDESIFTSKSAKNRKKAHKDKNYHKKLYRLRSHEILNQTCPSELKESSSFIALLGNLRKRDCCHDFFSQLVDSKKAGICLVTEPNTRRAQNEACFLDESAHAGAYTNKFLIGNTSSWIKYDEFISFKRGDIYVFNCYLNPNYKIDKFKDTLSRLEDAIKSVGGPVIVTGDFNSRSHLWGDVDCNPRGNILAEWILGNNLAIHNDMFNCIPTFYGPNGNSVIDLVLSSQEISRFIRCRVLSTDILSDHKCLLVEFSENPDDINTLERPVGGWYLDKKKLDIFSKKSREMVNEHLLTSEGLTPTKCTEIITNVCNELFTRKDAVPKKHAKYWWNDKIKQIRKDVFRIHRKIAFFGQQNRPTSILKDKLKTARQNLALEIKISKRDSWKKLIGDLDSNPFGRAYKAVTYRIKRTKRHDTHALYLRSKSNNLLLNCFPNTKTLNG